MKTMKCVTGTAQLAGSEVRAVALWRVLPEGMSASLNEQRWRILLGYRSSPTLLHPLSQVRASETRKAVQGSVDGASN